MKKFFLIFLLTFSTLSVKSQFIKEKSISAGIGYGLSFRNSNPSEELVAGGFFAQGELVLKSTNWVSFRPYVGLIITGTKTNQMNEKIGTQALLIGGKTRLRIPIPYVAPYTELGLVASIGSFQNETYTTLQSSLGNSEPLTFYYNGNKNGITYHIPFSMGLELGKNHGVDLGLVYYFQPKVSQIIGAYAVKLVFPLNKKP